MNRELPALQGAAGLALAGLLQARRDTGKQNWEGPGASRGASDMGHKATKNRYPRLVDKWLSPECHYAMLSEVT